MIAPQTQPYLNTREDATVHFLGVPTLIRSTAKTTSGSFGLIEHCKMPPGFASPYHTHHLEDEAFYVIEGTLAVVCGGEWMTAGPGSYVFGPREIPHGFKVVGDIPVRMLLLCAPGGFEKFVLELSDPALPPAPPDMGKLMAAAAKYHIDILGPLPDQPDSTAANGSGMSTNTNAQTSLSLHEAVDQTRRQHIAAVNAGDVEAAASLFSPDGVFLPPGQPALEGLPAIRGWFTHVFGQFRLQGFNLQPGANQQRGDTMIEHGSWEATFQPKNGSPGLSAAGTYLTVYARLSDGSVRMIRDTFNGMPG